MPIRRVETGKQRTTRGGKSMKTIHFTVHDEYKPNRTSLLYSCSADAPADKSGEYVRADDVKALVEALKQAIAEWEKDANFLRVNSSSEDRSAANVFSACAKQLEAALKAANITEPCSLP